MCKSYNKKNKQNSYFVYNIMINFRCIQITVNNQLEDLKIKYHRVCHRKMGCNFLNKNPNEIIQTFKQKLEKKNINNLTTV